ncbi:MAG TPA: Fe-S cluster assembly protein SufD [Gemmatimonadaceae bacterium]|nr:Fe-S cluster assembly protein SufD [Gemmatimonadaceae bacterium]
MSAPTVPAAGPFTADFDAAVQAGLGPLWLADARRAAFRRFQELGFPTPKNEDWHFTSVAPIAEAAFPTLRTASGDVTAADLAPYTVGHAEWPTLVFVNGRFAPELSTPADRLPDGVRVTTLGAALHGDAAGELAELLERHLTKAAAWGDHAFTALNTALMTDGAVLQVGTEMVVDAPIHLLYVSDAEAAKGTTHPRTLIVAGRHSKATVIESFVGLGEASYFTNAVTEVFVDDGATLTHYKVQRESPRAFHVGTVEVRQGRDSHFVSFSFATGGSLARTNIYTVLGGEGCGATLNGLYMLDGEQHGDHQTRIEHAEPNCFSREVYKGLLDGSSHGVFNGKVYVRPVAQKTDGKQENNNLLLSETARVDTKPQLEIFADDVKCTHGATVGRLDETALFYLKSRGVPATVARQLLTYAFAADVLETIELEPLKDALEALTLARFTNDERSANSAQRSA